MFTKIDGNRFRQLTRYIQEQVSAIGESLPTELPFETGGAIESLLARVLPPDDSSVQFSAGWRVESGSGKDDGGTV